MAQRLVADSSVALKWWLDDEQFVDEARLILTKVVAKDLELMVPELWLYEITNGINIAVKRDRITKELGQEFIEELQSIKITQIPIISYLQKIYEEAQIYRYAVYDISYMVIAEIENIPLITGDEKFFNTVKGNKSFVRYLSNLERIF
jgi:predicted nucleic acid-binding protein